MTNETAFPVDGGAIASGMTLRDYFAAKVMHYCLKNCFTFEGAVVEAYEIADLMLKAREQ